MMEFTGLLPRQGSSEKSRKRIISNFDVLEDFDDDDSLLEAGSMKMSKMSFDSVSNSGDRQNHSEIEKRRRDKMNTYIIELSSLLPMCSSMSRKLDKLTVLRMAVQHLKSLRGSASVCSEKTSRPSFLSEDEMKHLILKAAEGFLLVVSCDRARILYVSESVKNVLCYSRNDLIGQSLFDYLHPRDISKVKEQLSSSDGSPRERLIDARTMLPVKTEFTHRPTPTHLCSGARRAFFCQMKCGNRDMTSIKSEKDDIDFCHRRKKSDRKSYILIHCAGYLKSWSTSKVDIGETDEADDNCNLSCLVAVCQVKSSLDQLQISTNDKINVRPIEYISKHSIDGKFSYIDQGATILLGYLPQELLGTSVYEYYHQDDVMEMAETHRKVLKSKEKVETCVYRFKIKDGSFIHLRSRIFSFQNPWTKEVEYIVSTNTIIPSQEVSSSGQEMSTVSSGIGFDSEDNNYEDNESEIQSQPDRGRVNVPGVAGGTRLGAGRIGRQIAEEILELQRGQSSNTSTALADSTNPVGTPSPESLVNSTTTRTQFVTTTSVSSASSTHLPSGSSASSPHLPSGSSNLLITSTATCPAPLNGLSIKSTTPSTNIPSCWMSESSLIENVIAEQQAIEDMDGSDGNDEAAMSIIVSLLEADAGLGGPIDFNDIPWPL
ncbi:Aryl hydrocarbon receptor nuclear translocator-like protein 1 [Mizuhopecten yessoensis]|uniref:Aryl hydrocarbon receptor nuclear translocator-like protein 1 n=2 Tax=Mizuhopecten yessoensis TaxID=6573 RepID=A0A210R255_MIZYE|nr:Aryl hydrocarbon receptor nuclear translocator-like protein 1 [Mizuhopecten yessoensis]